MKETKNKHQYKELFSNLWFVIKFFYRVNKKLYLVRVPLIIVQSSATFVSIIFTTLILNALSINKDVKTAIFYSIAFALATFVVDVLRQLLSVYDSKQLEITQYKSNGILSREIMKLPYYQLEDPVMRDYISLAETSNNFFSVFEYLNGFISALINVLGLSAIVLTFDPIILVFIGVVAVVRMLIDARSRKLKAQFRDEHAPIGRKMTYLTDILTKVEFGKELRVNHLEDWFYDKADNYFREQEVPLNKKMKKKERVNSGLFSITYSLQEGVVYIILAYMVIFNGMPIGNFSMYLQSVNNFGVSIMGLLGCFSNLMSEGLYAKEFRYCVSFFDSIEKDKSVKTVENTDDINIEFKNVFFKYPNTDKMILKNISITLSSKETLSIVGVNGAGKTTFVKLLCRLYEPTEGEILINGIPINEISYEQYYKLIGVVFQDFKLFPFSVRENIELNTESDRERLENSIEKSGLTKKIHSLPSGADTMIFKEFDENGIEFSGGEGQKVAIARALYKDAPIIILDEPTSALDPIAEYEIYQHFNSLSSGKTTIYISHRLSSTRFTDKIAVFSDGELAEYGRHSDLMAISNGIYKNMFESQAQYYK